MMKIHCLQHVPFENPANILNWIQNRGYSVSSTRLFDNPRFPDSSDFDLLIVMGCRVYKNTYKEIGWHPVSLTREAKNLDLFKNVPHNLTAFHWHNDTFDIPENGTHIVYNKVSRNQGFSVGRNIVALQFHLEMNNDGIQKLIKNCKSDMIPGPYVQKISDIYKNQANYIQETNQTMDLILDNWLVSEKKDVS